METANNRIEINKINSDLISLEKQISDVAEGLKDVVTRSELTDMMNSFVVHLKNSPAGVPIVLFSDNVGNSKLHNIEFRDFCKEYPTVKVSMQKNGGIFHDRFIRRYYSIQHWFYHNRRS